MKFKEGETLFDIIDKSKVIVICYPNKHFERFIICHDGTRARAYEIVNLLSPKEYRNYKISTILND